MTTILGLNLNISETRKLVIPVQAPYEAGHKCSEADATQLNYARKQNIMNHLRDIKRIELFKTMTDDEVIQYIADYDSKYQLGAINNVVDPLQKEVRKLVGELLKMKFDITLKEAKEHPKYNELLSSPKIIAMAKANIANAQSTANALQAIVE